VAHLKTLRPGFVVVHPNRERAACRLLKAIVVAILLASTVLVLALTIGGWSKLQGMEPVNFIWSAVYVLIAVYIWRWARGLLPIAAALGILLGVIAAIAATGLDGTSWFARNHAGFAPARSLFGTAGLSPDVLGTLTVILIPVEAALAVVAMIGFAQQWNVELEIPEQEAVSRGFAIARRGRPVA
jgi:hypothetical protein